MDEGVNASPNPFAVDEVAAEGTTAALLGLPRLIGAIDSLSSSVENEGAEV